MKRSIFGLTKFEFPYRYKFPGQASGEITLFITRESLIVLLTRRAAVTLAALAILTTGWWFGAMLENFPVLAQSTVAIQTTALILASIFLIIGWWWVGIIWKKSIYIVTTSRIIKFVYTTPFNRHNFSLPLSEVVDTGAFSKGFIQAIFKLSTFTARSSAVSSGYATDDHEESRRINKKYFYIENISFAEDLQHYISKLQIVIKEHPDHLPSFRPFIPHLKGEDRKRFMKEYPEYWS